MNANGEPEADCDENGASGFDYKLDANYNPAAAGTDSDPEISRLAEENTLCLSDSGFGIGEHSDNEITGPLTIADDLPKSLYEPDIAKVLVPLQSEPRANRARDVPNQAVNNSIIGMLPKGRQLPTEGVSEWCAGSMREFDCICVERNYRSDCTHFMVW